MRLDDLTVEVRNRRLERVGQIRPEDLALQAEDDFNAVGAWTLTLAVEHPLAGALRTPGAGIIVTGPTDVLFSGPATESRSEATVTDPVGTLAIAGVTDTVLLADSLAYADPATYNPDQPFPWGSSAVADTRTGPVETLMHAYVNANIGPAAPVQRRQGTLLEHLTMGTNGGRGPTVTKTATYDQLGKLLTDLAVTADLGFRIVQRGGVLVFETYAIRDLTASIRLDIANSTLAGHKVIVGPPGATRILVQGKDLIDDPQIPIPITIRNFVVATTDASLQAEGEWGRRVEKFIDDSSHDQRPDLDQTGQEELAREGFTSLAVQAVPMDDSTMPYGRTWQLGDRIAVVVEQQELASTVTGYVLKADADGVRLGALAGDPTGFNRARATAARIGAVESRVGALERTTAATAASTAVRVDQQTDHLAGLPARMAAGKATLTTVANTPTRAVVTFPAYRFTAAPIVTVTPDDAAPQTVDLSVTGVSTTGFTIWATRPTGTATTLHWIAVQP